MRSVGGLCVRSRTVPANPHRHRRRGRARYREGQHERADRGADQHESLGGHGMTTSAAVGRLAADLLLAGPGNKAEGFSPERF